MWDDKDMKRCEVLGVEVTEKNCCSHIPSPPILLACLQGVINKYDKAVCVNTGDELLNSGARKQLETVKELIRIGRLSGASLGHGVWVHVKRENCGARGVQREAQASLPTAGVGWGRCNALYRCNPVCTITLPPNSFVHCLPATTAAPLPLNSRGLRPRMFPFPISAI